MMIPLIYGLRVVEFAILVRVLMTWIFPNPRDLRVNWFIKTVDSILKPFRVIIPVGGGAVDAGPILALLVLQILERILILLAYRGF